MTVADALMLALGVIAVGAGALVVTSNHLVRSGFYLVVSLGANAGLYLVLGAELVAWVQVLVYVGAVVVLLLFAVMLTRAPIGPSADLDRPAGPAAVIGAGVGFGLSALLIDAFRWTRFELPPPGNAGRVGEQIFGAWVLPFEVISILLLAALVGAIVLSRPDLGARRGPQPDGEPVPPPGPVDETDEVRARLERIAARQAAAQARVRQQAEADRLAAEEGAVATEAPPDPLKDKARDIIFGAGERRPTLGNEPLEPTDQPRVIEGSSRPTESRVIEGTARRGESRAIEGASRPVESRRLEGAGGPGESRQIEGSSRPTKQPAIDKAPSSIRNPEKSEISGGVEEGRAVSGRPGRSRELPGVPDETRGLPDGARELPGGADGRRELPVKGADDEQEGE